MPLSTPINNARTTLASAHAPGSGSLVAAAGTAARFGSPSPAAPVRVTVIAAASANTTGESAANLTIFSCTGISGDSLAVAAIEGSTDRAYAAGDVIEARPTAGTIADLNALATTATSPFVASGSGHSAGQVPDPGATAGTARFLREDATFAVPPAGAVSSVAGRTGAVVLAEADIANLVTDLAAKATDASVVHLAGAETIAGAKTFSAAITGGVTGQAGTVATIAGLVTAGANVVVSGIGTPASPFVIGATAAPPSPAGTTGQIQWNNAGVLAGVGRINAAAELFVGSATSVNPLTALGQVAIGLAMKSNTTPVPYVAAASVVVNSSFRAYNAFDGAPATTGGYIALATSLPVWIQMDFGVGASAQATSYSLTSRDTQANAPGDWTLQGSNDGTTWTTLDTRSGITFATARLTQTYTFAATTNHRFLRLNVTAIPGAGPYMELAQLTFVGNVTIPLLATTASGTTLIGSLTATGNAAVSGTSTLAGDVTTSGRLTVGAAYLYTTAAGAFWLDIPTTGSSGIGTGGYGVNPWIAYAGVVGAWFSDASTGDIVYRSTTNRLLLGATSGNAQIVVNSSTVLVHCNSTNQTPINIGGVAGQTGPLVGLQQLSSTSVARSAGYLDASLVVATDATWTGRATLSAGDYTSANAGRREGVRVESSGTAALLGFYGVAAVARPVLSYSRSGAGETAAGAAIRSALSALGLILDQTTT